MQSSAFDDYSGKTLGQFEILDELGRGGMATVYRARQKNMNRTVAIKVLPRALLHDPSFYERFVREVDLITRLEHPHILPIYDFGEADGVPYIAMRFLGGGSLAQWLRRTIPPVEALPRPMSQVAQALDYAHQQGIIHRDLKPGNILLDERGNAYLSDFGIAKVLNSNLTGSAIIGTPAYMSPEQAHGLPLDARSDIYSLGIVLYELLTGHEPFEAETPVALLLKHINEPMPSVRVLRPDVPEAVEAVVYRAAAKSPADRYPSAGDFADALAAAIPSTSTRSRVTSVPVDSPTLVPETAGRVTPPVALQPDMPTITPPPMARPPSAPQSPAAADTPAIRPDSRPSRRMSPLIVLGGFGVLAAMVIVIALVITSQPPAPVYVTPTFDAALAAVPTAFTQGVAVEDAAFSITTPADWEESDLSTGDVLVRLWRMDDLAYIGLALYPPLGDASELNAQIENWEATQNFAGSVLIDEAVAPDGTVRRSYRTEARPDSGLEAGQHDLFFSLRGGRFVVLDLFAGDSRGNALVPVFQQVLDSLRIAEAAPAA